MTEILAPNIENERESFSFVFVPQKLETNWKAIGRFQFETFDSSNSPVKQFVCYSSLSVKQLIGKAARLLSNSPLKQFVCKALRDLSELSKKIGQNCLIRIFWRKLMMMKNWLAIQAGPIKNRNVDSTHNRKLESGGKITK